MLNQRIRDFAEPHLHSDEQIVVAMAGFRPLTRSAALLSVFPLVLGGLAAGPAAGINPWIGGAIGGGLGVGMTAWLDQRRARAEHDGKGLSIGLVVTGQRLFILNLAAGLIAASVEDIHLEQELGDLTDVETERMQGSGMKRVGLVLGFRDGTIERVIPARLQPFLDALDRT
ncbi:MAG: hypothetical protein V3V29_09455 [Acidimicrobiia bacterium]